MTNDVEHLFMCLLAICVSSLEKMYSILCLHFLTGLSFHCSVVRILYMFWTRLPEHMTCQTYDLQMFSPILLYAYFHKKKHRKDIPGTYEAVYGGGMVENGV